MNVNQVLFLDIETVSQKKHLDDLPDQYSVQWQKKANSLLRYSDDEITPDKIADLYEEKAAIYAEFGKVICISVGYIKAKTSELRIKSFAGDDEKQLLTEFCFLLDNHFNNPTKNFLCGHNIKEFDVPYLCRRMLVCGLPLPKLLQVMGKKSWQTSHLLDTLEMWKFGDYKHYTSLSLLTTIFEIPSPKGDIDGSEVGGVYWEEGDLDRITKYCERDVVAVARLYLKMTGSDTILEENISQIGSQEEEEE